MVRIEDDLGQLLAVLGLIKADERVIRQVIIEKLISNGVKIDLANELLIFVLLLLVKRQYTLQKNKNTHKGLNNFCNSVACAVTVIHLRPLRRTTHRPRKNKG